MPLKKNKSLSIKLFNKNLSISNSKTLKIINWKDKYNTIKDYSQLSKI